MLRGRAAGTAICRRMADNKVGIFKRYVCSILISYSYRSNFWRKKRLKKPVSERVFISLGDETLLS